jgi:hypothetical protein
MEGTNSLPERFARERQWDIGGSVKRSERMWIECVKSASWDWYEHIPTDSWDEIVAHYRRNYDAGWWGGEYLPMLKLVEEIATSPYAAQLFGKYTSLYPIDHHRGQLDLCRTQTLVRRHQMLTISFVPADNWFLFEYFETTYEPKPWATVCTPAEGFAKLEWVLNKRLRWFRRA